MKKIRAALLLLGSILLLFSFSGCQARTVTVDTVLTVDSSWSGSRVMTVSFAAKDYPDEQSRAALDGLIAQCPGAMTYGKQEKDSQIQYTFTLEFVSYEDYQKKLEALMGSAPYGVFTKTDSIFFKGTRIYEDFDSTALFSWLSREEKPGFSLRCGAASVVLNGETMPTPGRITVNQVVNQQPVDKISVSTVSYGNDTYDRTFAFYIPKSTVLALGDDLISYMNARSEGADSSGWQEYPSGNIYTAAFRKVSLERLEEITGLLMNTYSGSKISYASQPDAETYFSKRAAFEETLDLSAYGGEDGGGVKIEYEYENKSSMELFAPQRYQGGSWEAFGALEENTVHMEATGAGMKIRIPDGWDYPVEEAQITLICLGKGNYTRQIDFLFPKDGKQGADYAAEMLKERGGSLEITQLEDEERLICRVSFSGTAEEISRKVKTLFGQGNSFSYESQGQGVDLNQEVSIIDEIQMGYLFRGEHRNVPVTYTVQTNGKENLTSLHYEGESRNRDIKIVNGSVIESFQLDGGSGRVVYNGTEPRFWGVVFYFTIALLVVAGAVILIVFLRRRAKHDEKGSKPVFRQLAETKVLPGETPEEAQESVEDILSKL